MGQTSAVYVKNLENKILCCKKAGGAFLQLALGQQIKSKEYADRNDTR